MRDVDFTITENLSAALKRAREFGGDMTPAMGEIARSMATSTKFNFKNERDPLGVPWKKSKRAQDEGGQTLFLSGDLFGSIHEQWGNDFAAAGPEASGGAAIYAAIHQWGGRIAAKAKKALRTPFGVRRAVTIPARPYVGWNPALEDASIDILADHVRIAMIGGAMSS